jgi:hypothetical protein
VKNIKLLPLIVIVLICLSCKVSKPRVKERTLCLNKEIDNPIVEVDLKMAKLVFAKKDVVNLIDKSLNSNSHPGTLAAKQKLKEFLSESQERHVISSTAHPDELDGMVSIIDRLLKKRKAIVYDKEGKRINRISMREEYLIFGSFQKSFYFLDGQEIIITVVKFGE